MDSIGTKRKGVEHQLLVACSHARTYNGEQPGNSDGGIGFLRSSQTCLAWSQFQVWAAVQVPATSAADPPTQLLLKRIELLQQLHRNAEEHFAEREDAHLGYIAELEYQLTATQAQLKKVGQDDAETIQQMPCAQHSPGPSISILSVLHWPAGD